MQTFIHTTLIDTEQGREAERILRACVHCGFCNATCPTYQLLGDERDGPRGRIYLIREMLQTDSATRETQLHLDRCLTCRACETTCPSGVEYNSLLEIGRALVEKKVPRTVADRARREALMRTVPEPSRLKPLLKLASWVRPVLPAAVARSVPNKLPHHEPWPQGDHARTVLLLEGCVQSVTHPGINLATARVLDRLGIRAIPAAGCCGALSHHLSREEQTTATMKRNIDQWWPLVEAGAEALLLTATGCAPTVQDYGRLLAGEPAYAEKAERMSAMTMDISEYFEQQDLEAFRRPQNGDRKIAFHAPCSLQHALKRGGRVERMLTGLGYNLTPVQDAHLCCGSAGSYSILQPELSRRLLQRKLASLEAGAPNLIATANIGCLTHLQGGTGLEVRHWIELLPS